MQEKPSYEELEKRVRELEKEQQKYKQAELSLQASEALFRGLFDNMTSGCSIYEVIGDGSKGKHYIIKNFNKTSLKLEGKTISEVVGKTLSDLRPTIDDYGLIPIFKKVWETGIPDFFPVKIYQDEKFSNYYENYIFRLPSGEVIAIYNDVTEQKNNEVALRQSEARLRTVVDTIPDLVWLKDTEGVYLSCNPTFERFFGVKESKIIGKTDYDFNDKELADFFRKHDRIAMDADRPSVNEEWLTFAENGYHGLFETVKTPMRDADGNLIGVLGIARDITERKKAEDTLKENDQRYKKGQRIGRVGNWEYDLVTEKIWGSDEAKRIYGFDPESKEFTVDQVEDCIPERERVHQVLIDLIEKGSPYNLEFEILPIDGSQKKIVRSIAEVIKDNSGVPLKVAGVLQDITQQKKTENENIFLERQLRQAQKLESIGLLAGGIAHDFNNILGAVIGYSELALAQVERSTVLENYLRQVLIAGLRAKDLVSQILAFARQSDEEIKPVRVDMIVGEVLKLLRSAISTTIEIQRDLKSDSLVMGNPTQIHQIFMNLCTNAFHAMEDGSGVLRIGLYDVTLEKNVTPNIKKLIPGKYLKITISDTGAGIEPGIVDSIFDPYFTTKGIGKGSGMGLAVVHGIVEKYGGMITVSSELGKGSLFTIYLPVTREKQRFIPTIAEKLPTGTERILVIDDELPIVDLLKPLLVELGYSVTTRTDSVEALELFKSKPDEFDLVVTDMSMPNLTGDKLAIELMKIRPDIPVILCSGYNKWISNESAAKIGIKAFINKPVMAADLAGIVRNVLDESGGLNQK